MARNLLRNTRVFVSTVQTGFDDTNTWELSIQDDFSYSQGNEVQEISVAEAGASPVRGQAVFNTSLNPVEWSFSTYLRPFIGMGTANALDHRAMELPLWHGLVAAGDPSWDGAVSPIASTISESTIDFTLSNAHELYKYNIYVWADNIWYLIEGAQINQAEVDFGIDAIGMVTWSGNGIGMSDVTAGTLPSTGVLPPSTDADYIKNRLTTLSLVDGGTTYAIAITGGSLTINNNITYLTPDTLSTVDSPIGSFTGTRQINGNLTCYLNSGTDNSADLLKSMLANSSLTQNSHDIAISLGGATAPNVVFDIPTAHLSIPNTEVADVIGLSIDFYALSDTGIDGVNEMTIIYTGATTDTSGVTYYDATA
jgi:hypothetical protein